MVEAWNGLVEFLFASKDPSFIQTMVIALISALLVRALSPKAKLTWFYSHQFVYQIPTENGPPSLIKTRQIFFHNSGKAPVEHLEVVFNYSPQHLEVWNPRHFEFLNLPNSRILLRFDSIMPRETFTISMLNHVVDLPDIVNLRTRNGTIRPVNIQPQEVWPRWRIWVFWALAFLGLAVCIQAAIRMLLAWNEIAPSGALSI